jgi:serine/threonine protein kinase
METGTLLAGKYRIGAVLGRGGMGVVAAAHHLQLRQPVAIKFLHPVAGHDAEAIKRLLREAQAAARLRSEHVARVLDVGALANGVPFIVMEHLEGQDLAGMVRAGPLAPGAAVDLIVQACEALAEAHALGIVHRDLKPSNLFVTRRPDGSSLLKVLDFGISKNPLDADAGAMDPLVGVGGDALDTARSDDGVTATSVVIPLPPPVSAFPEPTSTRTEAIMGTPEYMSPEHMRSSKHVDARTDVWSIGVVLYELLSGNRPFRADTRAGLRTMVETAPLPPLAGKVPAGLARVVARCLEKAPDDRYQDVAALAAALAPFSPTPDLTQAAAARMSRVLLGGHVHGDAPGLRRSAGARRSRRRAMLAAGALVAAAAVFFALGPDVPEVTPREAGAATADVDVATEASSPAPLPPAVVPAPAVPPSPAAPEPRRTAPRAKKKSRPAAEAPPKPEPEPSLNDILERRL